MTMDTFGDSTKIFANTDIYLIDQILKGNFDNYTSVLDAGCGAGRNLPYFLHQGFDVYGIDQKEECIQKLRQSNPSKKVKFKTSSIENIPFDNTFDLIICNAVLHFAENRKHFESMLYGMWEKLNSNGILFIRSASDIGIENRVVEISDRVFKLPDGTNKFLVNLDMMLEYTEILKAELVEKIKTTNVQNLRCMTTWVLKKSLK